jgi:methyl-accepting chemotaxis protein
VREARGKKDEPAMRQTDRLPPPVSIPANRSEAQPLPRIRSDRRRSGNLLMNVSIGTRLTLSFMIAALIAAMATGTIGFQHAQSLNKQSDFYLNLLQSNTSLTTGVQFLQEINSITQNILIVGNTPQSSQETLRNNLASLQNLNKLYSGTLTSFVNDQLVSKHPDEQALLYEANHGQQVHQQETLAASALRTWHVADVALSQFMADVTAGQFGTATTLQQALLEPANADALTALRSLVNFNKRLANSVKDAADVEAFNQLITTIISSVIAFLAILFIGWLISGTLVRRLLSLRQVTQAVEHGNLAKRVKVIGRDEIADVSASVNAMLNAIVNLVNESRNQHDALVNAADHLFSEMRVVSAGDLRVNAPVSNDPIGMLANAFNFTIGRFRRFVLRSKTLSEQLHVIARREAERAEAFSLAIQSIETDANSQILAVPTSDRSSSTLQEKRNVLSQQESQPSNTQLVAHLNRTREQLRQVSQEGILNHAHAAGELYEQITQTLNRLSEMAFGRLELSVKANVATMTPTYIQEIRTLDILRARLEEEMQSLQRNTIRGFQGLDQDLQHLYIALLCQPSSNENVETVSTLAEQDPHLQDILRLGTIFADEVTSLSRQLTELAQEMQNAVVSFQFEGGDTLMNNLPNPS